MLKVTGGVAIAGKCWVELLGTEAWKAASFKGLESMEKSETLRPG